MRRLWECGGIVYPNTAGLEFGKAEHELAAPDTVGVDVFEDGAAVGVGDVADGCGGDIGAARARGRVLRVRGRADKIELGGAGRGRCGGGGAFERHVFFAEANVEAVKRSEGIGGSADAHRAGAGADVEDTDLAAFEEKSSAEGAVNGKHERRGGGDGGADDHAVKIGVMGNDRAKLKETADEKGLAKLLGRERVRGGGRGK